jgi:hypothetical protein
MPPTYPTYIKKDDRQQLDQVRKRAVEQIQRYMKSREMLGRPNLKAVALTFIGKGEIVVDHFQ